jgi:hypothetical protein
MHVRTQASPPAGPDSRITLLTDAELERRLGATLSSERAAMLEFLLHLGEFDRRRAYLDRGYPSLFDYCTRNLRLSKAAAFRRIAASRLLRRFPAAGDMLRDGRLCLTTLAELRDILTEENSENVLQRASGLTREQVEALVAASRPAPEAPPDSVRSLPLPRLVSLPLAALSGMPHATGPSSQVTEAPPGMVVVAVPQVPPDRVKPISAELRVLRVTVTQEFLDELAEVKLSLSHTVPDGRFEDVVRQCFRLVLERDRARRGPAPRATKPAKPNRSASEPVKAGEAARRSRHIPRAVKGTVWARDRGQCAYRAPDGRVCGSRYRLQYHHCEPFGVGGEATAENISLRCAAHNGMHARRDYGRTATRRAGTATPRRAGTSGAARPRSGAGSASGTNSPRNGPGPTGTPGGAGGHGSQVPAPNNP